MFKVFMQVPGIEPGTLVTIGTKQYLVTSSSKTESNTAFQEGSISCRRADNATLHPITTGEEPTE